MKKSVFIRIGLLLNFFGFSEYGYGEPLLLEAVLTSVEQHYPLIISSRADLRRAQAEHFSSQGGFDPALKASYSNTFEGYYNNSVFDLSLEQPTSIWGTTVIAGWRNGQGSFPVYDTKRATFTGGEARAGIEVPILRGGVTDERRTKVRSAEFGIDVAQEGLKSQRLEVQKQAAQRYWDWIATGRKVGVARELLEITLDRNEAIRKKIKHGDLPEIDQVDNLRLIVQREAALIGAERAFQKASLELAIYFRDSDGNPSVEPMEQLPKTYSTEKFTLILENINKIELNFAGHPEVKRIGFQMNQFTTEYKLAKNQILPKLNLHFGAYSEFGVNPGNIYLPSTGAPVELRAGLILEFPLLFRAPRGRLEVTQASLDKIETIQRLTLNKLEIQSKDSIQAMKTAYEKFKLAQKEIKFSKKLEESERIRAFHGDSSFLLVNLREQASRDAMGKEIDAYSEFFKANAEYLASLGESLDSSSSSTHQ